MAKKAEIRISEEYYTRLIIYKKRRTALILLATLLLLTLTFFIFQFNTSTIKAHDLFLVIILAAPLLIFFPRVEEWEYRPWQCKAIQYEKHYSRRK